MRLEAAKGVLLDKDQRDKYDQWRSGGFKHVVSFNDWLAMQSRVHSVSCGCHGECCRTCQDRTSQYRGYSLIVSLLGEKGRGSALQVGQVADIIDFITIA